MGNIFRSQMEALCNDGVFSQHNATQEMVQRNAAQPSLVNVARILLQHCTRQVCSLQVKKMIQSFTLQFLEQNPVHLGDIGPDQIFFDGIRPQCPHYVSIQPLLPLSIQAF
jgi:hypothetical protein